MEMYTLDTAMIRLKEIAEELESGEHDLEMSMKLYEEGVRIITFCNKALSNAKQKVVELSQYDNEEDEIDDDEDFAEMMAALSSVVHNIFGDNVSVHIVVE